MKFASLALLAAVLSCAAAASAPYTLQVWSLQELNDALADPNTDPALKPYLEQAMNEIVTALMSGQQITAIPVAVPVSISQSPAAASTAVAPATVSTEWTLQELSHAILDPNTDPELLPHLQQALNDMMTALHSGQQIDTIAVSVPVVADSSPAIIEIPTPIEEIATPIEAIPTPIEAIPVPEISEVETPEIAADSAVETEVTSIGAAPSSPLVQIMININNEESQQVDPTLPRLG